MEDIIKRTYVDLEINPEEVEKRYIKALESATGETIESLRTKSFSERIDEMEADGIEFVVDDPSGRVASAKKIREELEKLMKEDKF